MSVGRFLDLIQFDTTDILYDVLFGWKVARSYGGIRKTFVVRRCPFFHLLLTSRGVARKNHAAQNHPKAEQTVAAKAARAAAAATCPTSRDLRSSHLQSKGDVESEPKNPDRIRMTASYRKK
ncbi:hypothetical protein Syun_007111 [Stephania yunnanensis]|uniref:Uncharacterized protein n=1 Tax=Stephania yunnanensis TaxID=152371 RepID=A0AAP0L0I4_9MAGN